MLRDTLRDKRPDLRVVLMSATLDEDLFASYFATGGAKEAPLVPSTKGPAARPAAASTPSAPSERTLAPCLRVPGRTFPVDAFFLEHALQLTGHSVRPNCDWARRDAGGFGRSPGANFASQRRERAAAARGGGGGGGGGGGHRNGFGGADWVENPETMGCGELGYEQLRQRYRGWAEGVPRAMAALDHNAVDIDLICQLLVWLGRTSAATLTASYLRWH